MVEVKAFNALEYDPTKVDVAKAMSPPFDVINEAARKKLAAASPHNVVRLTLADQGVSDKRKRAQVHKAAAKLLEEWVEQGVLVTTKEPCIYAYQVDYVVDGDSRRMRGMIGLLRIDPEYNQVVGHENVFDGPVEARLGLLTETAVDLEPIQMIYSGKSVEGSLWSYIDGTGRNPDILGETADGSTHQLWRVVDTAIIGTVLSGFKGRKVYIADGHHRYATHVRYSQERRSAEYRPPRSGPYDYKMCVLVHGEDAGGRILPTHRIIMKARTTDLETLKKRWSQYFEVEKLPGKKPEQEIRRVIASEGTPAIAVYLGKKGGLWKLTAQKAAMPEELAPERSFAWRLLDPAWLQVGVVKAGFGVPEKSWGTSLRYTQDWSDALGSVDAGKAVAAAFHRPVTSKQLRAVADAGENMPPKSTDFVPKVISGAAYYRIGKKPAGRVYRKPTS